MAPCGGRAKGARKTHFKGYWLVVFLPCNMRKLTACALQRKGIPRQLARGGKFWQSTGVRIPSLPLELMNNKLNNKKNELWKMKLSK